jgi:hypothetical protein
METTPRAAPPPAPAGETPSRPADGLPLPPLPVPGVDFPTFAECYRALHRAPRS